MIQDQVHETVRHAIAVGLTLLLTSCSRVSDSQSVPAEIVAPEPSDKTTDDVASHVSSQPDIVLPIGRRVQQIVVEYHHFGSAELPETKQFVVRPSDQDALIQALGIPKFQTEDRQRRFLGDEVANILISYDGYQKMRVLLTFTTGPVLFYSIDGVRYRSDWSKQSPMRDSIMFTAFLEDLEKQGAPKK